MGLFSGGIIVCCCCCCCCYYFVFVFVFLFFFFSGVGGRGEAYYWNFTVLLVLLATETLFCDGRVFPLRTVREHCA